MGSHVELWIAGREFSGKLGSVGSEWFFTPLDLGSVNKLVL